MASDFKGQWLKLHTEIIEAIDEPTQTDCRLTDRLVQNLRTAAHHMELADAEPLVEGSTGQLTEHPSYKVAARCDSTAVSLARQLKLTRFVRERDASDETEETEDADDPIFKARDDLAARRRSRAA